jgi:hypothetical protein
MFFLLHNIYQRLEVFVVEYSLMLESGILQANHHSINQYTFSNLKQN